LLYIGAIGRLGWELRVSVTTPATGSSAARDAGQAAVEVGRVFGEGGTDGLILYALILATFLMFLALVIITIYSFRAIGKMQTTAAEQTKAFADASDTVAEALRELASSIAAQAAADGAHQSSLGNILGRCESVLSRLEPVLRRQGK
jgi:hypothetical protein